MGTGISHEDAHERGPGPELVNYLGLPITDAARSYGLAWDASRFTVPEHQCEVHIVGYIYRGPLNLRISEERDPVSRAKKLIAIKNYIDNYEQSRTIYMDDRPHPPGEAAHTWMGFLDGKVGWRHSDGLHPLTSSRVGLTTQRLAA